MAEVFISYRHFDPDQKLAAELSKYLAEHQVCHFVDTEIRIGQEWVKVIDRELRHCASLSRPPLRRIHPQRHGTP
jgi:hypothetical protein